MIPPTQPLVRRLALVHRLTRRATDRIGISTQEGLTLLRFDQILYCEAMANYCRIWRVDGSSIVVSKPLKDVLACLPASEFLRSHQSYAVRIHEVVNVHQGLTLSNGKWIPVSRSQKTAIAEFFKSYVHCI